MRLWSLHPCLLDRAALVAGWREGLLAQKVLQGATKGYRHHPQLVRFRSGAHPEALIATYLTGLADEADARQYSFRRELIATQPADPASIPVTSGQLDFEFSHLEAKVRRRDPGWLERLTEPSPHPLFRVIEGTVERWERGTVGSGAGLLLEERETELAALRASLVVGEHGGEATVFDFDEFIASKTS